MDNEEEIIRDYWDKNNLNIRFEILLKDGQLSGVSKSWYRNGQKEIECSYSEGKKHGVLKHWHENGNIFREEFYVMRKKTRDI